MQISRIGMGCHETQNSMAMDLLNAAQMKKESSADESEEAPHAHHAQPRLSEEASEDCHMDSQLDQHMKELMGAAQCP